jgi:metal-dependent amidase/aminoacylase/carboxypeptidase family protein
LSSVEEILAGYDDLQAGQEAFYKDLHEHPELSHQEHRTAQRVAGKLQEYGFTVHAGIGDLPTNHSPKFVPPLQPTLRTGTEALVTAALAWLEPR